MGKLAAGTCNTYRKALPMEQHKLWTHTTHTRPPVSIPLFIVQELTAKQAIETK